MRVPTTQPHQPPSDFSAAMSRHLRQYMEEHSLTVNRLAAELGRSRVYVYEHTSGLRPPDTDLFNAVARLTGTDVRSLLMILMGRMGTDTKPH